MASPLLFLLFSFACGQSFDGVVRPTSDGRAEAYMIPPFKSNHASFLEKLPNGGLVMAWFSGATEGADNVSIVVAHLPPNSTQWSKASVVAQRSGYSNQNPVLFYRNATGILYLFHSQQKAKVPPSEDSANVWTRLSYTMGMNWTEEVDVFTKPGSFDRNRIIERLNGDLLVPMYFAHGGSEDQFSAMQTKSDNEKDWHEHDVKKSNYLVQPSVIRPKPGVKQLTAYFRDRRHEHIYMSTSTDDGDTWTEPKKTKLPNNNSGIQANVLNYTSGNVVLCFNPTNEVRNPMTIGLSEDGGNSWAYQRNLEYKKESVGVMGVEYSYPSVLQTSDGYIHVSYTYNRETIKYVRFHEDWIKQK